MKNKLVGIIFILGGVFGSCTTSNDTEIKDAFQADNTVTEFLRDVKTIEKDTNVNPILSFKDLAEDIAIEKIILSKENINEALILAKDYSSCVVVTANHTIVKIENLEDCQQSGSWKACMPKCSGYIKKGELNFKTDYMNNIIGVPDNQQRVAFFFDPIQKLQVLSDSSSAHEIKTADYPYIHVVSRNQSSMGWEDCDDFYCNNFYLTDSVYDYHPVFKDQKNQFLFFLKEWGNWIFCCHFPNEETIKAILNNEIDVPKEDRICFVNSFDPCGVSIMLKEDFNDEYEPYTLEGEYSEIDKVLKWEGVFDYSKYEEKMLNDQKLAYYKLKKENFNNLLSLYNNSNSDHPIPDTTIEKGGFSFRVIMINYLKKHYSLKEDSTYDSNDDLELHVDGRLAEGGDYYISEDDYYISEKVIDKYYSSNSNNLSKQIAVLVHDYEGEMDFSNECTVTFPNFKREDVIQLLKLLEIYDIQEETEQVGSCEYFYKEVYYSESENIQVHYNADSTETVVSYAFSGGGC